MKLTHPLARLLAISTLASTSALAQTITVNWSQDDYLDFGGLQRVADLPGPDGHVTFYEAITAANNTPGPQTIAFAVPQADWWTLFGTEVCIFEHTIMHYITGDDTTIDFTTQTAFTGDTNPLGNEVGFYYAGAPSGIPNIWLAGNRITVKGLDRLMGNNFEEGLWISGNDCRVLGCTTASIKVRGDYGGGDNNIIGGTAPGEGNRFSAPCNILSGASGNVVIGNTFRYGLRITGDTMNGTCNNTRIGGPTLAERNIFSGHGYTAEEGLPSGTELEVYHARDTRIEGNFVGTSDDGLSRYAMRTGAAGIGVGLGAVDTVITGNTVAGIERTGSNHYQGLRFGVGIGVSATASGTRIIGNRVGVGVDGVTPILNVKGIVVASDPNGTPVGTVIEQNIVRTSETTGVWVYNGGSARITRNSISTSTGLGIDLGTLGVTPNDALDADTGPNSLQNFPTLLAADASGGTVHITGSLSSTPSRAFTIEFFANATCHASGYGEGATYLGSATVTTNNAGNAAFDISLAGSPAPGTVLTATATDAVTLQTSEFSACTAINVISCDGDVNCDFALDGFDVETQELAVGGDTIDYCRLDPDFNGDFALDGFDVEAVEVVVGGGPCP